MRNVRFFKTIEDAVACAGNSIAYLTVVTVVYITSVEKSGYSVSTWEKKDVVGVMIQNG